MTEQTSPSPKEAFPLTIPRPCPMLVSRMTPEGDNFHCRTCQHVTYDLRDKSQEEVHAFVKRHQEQGLRPCVIVHDEQLHKVPEYRGIKRWVMAALTAASWLGFAVSPLSAQADSTTTSSKKEVNAPSQTTIWTSENQPQQLNLSSDDQTSKKKKWRLWPFRRPNSKGPRTLAGCPAWD